MNSEKMGRRAFLKKIAALGLTATAGISVMTRASKPPNVLLITVDDLNWDSLGCMGNKLKGISPNTDQLATDGILIEHTHIVTPICGPSRHALLTGYYPQRSGYMGHGKQPPRWWKDQGRTVSEKSIASILSNQGYLTSFVGKHGSDWCKFNGESSTRSSGEGRRTSIRSEQDTGLGRNPAKYYAYARDFLNQAKEQGKPFYLSANTHDPHRYWARHRDETKEWIDIMMGSTSWSTLENGKPYPDPKTQFDPADIPVPASYPNDMRLREDLAKYYDSVNRMDESVGEVLRALNESGMADDTIVMFISDHGLAWDMSKWTLYPSGTKTPLIVRWPGRITPGQVDRTSVLSAVDIAPTILEMCGLPPMEGVDGVSFLDILSGDASRWKRTEAFTCFNYMNNEPEHDELIESYTPDLYKRIDQYRPSRALSSTQYTYIWNGWSDGTTEVPNTMGEELRILMGKYALDQEDKNYPEYEQRVRFMELRETEELYDTVEDPGCLNNLVQDLDYRAVIDGFRERMVTMLQDTHDHELQNFLSFVKA